MKFETITYKHQEVTYKKVYNFILGNLPDYTIPLDSLDSYEAFSKESEINKVVLFSSKSKTPSIFKALAQTFKDRLRFGFIS